MFHANMEVSGRLHGILKELYVPKIFWFVSFEPKPCVWRVSYMSRSV